MATVHVLRANPAVSDDDLAKALMSATDLDEDPMLRQIAAVLRHNGFEVAYEP